MKVNEILSGTLSDPNIPDFTHYEKECVTDGYEIVSTTFKGKYALGILDDNKQPMTYCLIDPAVDGINRLYEIHTLPEYRGKNLAGILLLALKGELGLKLMIDKNDILSVEGRRLLYNMCRTRKMSAKLHDGTQISLDNLKEIFNDTFDNDYTLIFEGAMLKREIDPDRQGKINSWWYLRTLDGTIPDQFDMDADYD